ncbi:type II toxin-antitoxin system RelE/ParE family toxin [Mesorhizobium sp. M7A.F.Ca.CA.001.07.2.1]|uniref:type II toxin-antitoxin system RelE/ParE family toxin n=2 Tax=Phyllobacteriaceae TaxID=69277 RepID=UPI000FCC27D7|nr:MULTISPECIES: type II toxin-antitoxin system RelE/ParE family toxin [Mesorhizobium]RVB40678.1 type II toxin-antitoxin system RelE/ParE family toxin [Mesorhizobium sp. M7A.F.Ca.CA.004.05.1.1]RWN97929.1 MAG: type II toxin-antitoxin system RelE/ParE family toxin [Mesorhizobium sp.]MCF6123515.1 type II toxin-antitoxin system RelE/ParE family toxin [Mesorhizobium ciceri]MCQ8815467.1 type II toxin-antitoxin system RelE/ParE family toxin [Mesorhizobium sp. SEMIA396]RUU81890.1 type II toxin-antitox
MVEVRQTTDFRDWLNSLRDKRAAEKIAIRIARVQSGLIGDVKYFDGIGELRLDVGPGYRLYFIKRGNEIIILLCGGDKSSQGRDIKKAIQMAREL